MVLDECRRSRDVYTSSCGLSSRSSRSLLDFCLRPQYLPQNTPDRLRPRRLRVRLLRDPSVQGGLNVRVKPQSNLRPDPCAWSAALVFLTLSYCVRLRLMVPTTDH